MVILKGKTFVAYVRVSSDKQDAERQRATIKGWEKQTETTIAKWYEDTTGHNPRDKADKRASFQRLIKDIEAGTIPNATGVIVDSLDRFGVKNAWELGKYISKLREHGFELWSVAQGNLSSDDAATILTSTVGAITSTREQEEKSLRNITGKVQKAKAGEYQGGYPPFGCDVVCFDTKGKEKWRVVYDGHYSREKITKGKKPERYDGKDNFPAKDPTDVLGVRPSVKADRIKIVKQIFDWYSQENISPAQIANRLNRMEVSAVYAVAWEKVRITSILSQPAYLGLPTFNKSGGSRFFEYVGGRVQRVQPIKGKIVSGRKRDKADYVQPENPLFKPIIDPKLFDRVQEKLQASSERHRNTGRNSNRIGELWLRNFLVCAKCGKPMRCQASTKSRNVVSYFCSTYGTYGRENPTDCRCHRVKADVLHKIVEQYLAEANQRIAGLLKAEQTHNFDAAKQVAKEFYRKHEEIYDLFTTMHGQVNGFMQEHGRKDVMADFAKHEHKIAVGKCSKSIEGLGPFAQLYGFIHQQRKPELDRQYKSIDAEHSTLVKRVLGLPENAKAALRKANEQILSLESQLHDVDSERKNLADEVEHVIGDLATRKQAIDQIRKSVGNEAAFRRKAALLGQVVDRIVCHFRYSPGKNNRAKSYLDVVQIFPIESDPVKCFPDGEPGGPG